MLSHTPFRPLAKRLGSRPVLVSGRNETPAVAAAYGYRDFVTSLQLGAAYPHAVPFSLSAQGAAAPGFSDCAAPQPPWAQQLQHLVRCGLEQLLGGQLLCLPQNECRNQGSRRASLEPCVAGSTSCALTSQCSAGIALNLWLAHGAQYVLLAAHATTPLPPERIG